MRERIRGYAAAVFEAASEAGHLERLAEELLAFADAAEELDNLRSVLTDRSVTPTVRRIVVSELLAGRALDETSALISYIAVTERPPEVLVSLSAVVAGAESEAEAARHSGLERALEPPGATLIVRERIRGYVERVLEELASVEELDVVEDELFAIARLLDGEPNLRRVLSDPGIAYSHRRAVLVELLASKARAETIRIASYVLRAGRLRDLVGTFDWLVSLAAEERGRRIADVRSAVELSEDERRRLAEALQQIVHREVEIRVVLDQSVIGGMLVSVGDFVIDGTVRLRFERLRDLLVHAA